MDVSLEIECKIRNQILNKLTFETEIASGSTTIAKLDLGPILLILILAKISQTSQGNDSNLLPEVCEAFSKLYIITLLLKNQICLLLKFWQ